MKEYRAVQASKSEDKVRKNWSEKLMMGEINHE